MEISALAMVSTCTLAATGMAAYAHITQRGPHWLVRITAPALPRPLWRKYSRATHTDAEAVMQAARHVGCPDGQTVRVCWRGWLG